MTQPDHEIIKQVLAAVLSTEQDTQGQTEADRLDPRPGTLTVSTPATYATPDEAWQAFAGGNGPGWLQNAHTPPILHGDDLSQQLTNCKDPHWPVAGERVSTDGQTSLLLRRAAEGWAVTTLTEAVHDQNMLLTQRLLSTDLTQYLVYIVAYRPERVGGHHELRPFASRFVGFEGVPAKSTQPDSPQPA
jgi:hypothetical protein